MKYMVMLLTAALTGLAGYAQNLMDATWQIDKIIGQDNVLNTREYTLHKADVKKGYPIYGNSIIFKKDHTFVCSYAADCGNDCFPSSTGTFVMADEDHISLKVKTFSQEGDCPTINKTLNLDIGTYYISKQPGNVIKLKKIVAGNGPVK